MIKTLKDEKRRKLVLLGEQYDQSITEMLQKQTVRLDESQMVSNILYTMNAVYSTLVTLEGRINVCDDSNLRETSFLVY